jgi:hypothetical protein
VPMARWMRFLGGILVVVAVTPNGYQRRRIA